MPTILGILCILTHLILTITHQGGFHYVPILQMWKQRWLKILLRPKARASKHPNLTPGSLAPHSLPAQYTRLWGSEERFHPVLARKYATWNPLSFFFTLIEGMITWRMCEGRDPICLIHPRHSPSSIGTAVKKETQWIFAKWSKIIYSFEMTVFFTYNSIIRSIIHILSSKQLSEEGTLFSPIS